MATELACIQRIACDLLRTNWSRSDAHTCRMQDPTEYRLWKEAMAQQANGSPTLSASSRAWKAFSWTLLAGLTLAALALAAEVRQPGSVSSIQRSAGIALSSDSHLISFYMLSQHLPGFHLPIQMSANSEHTSLASVTMFPEIKQNVHALSNKAGVQNEQDIPDIQVLAETPVTASDALFPEIKQNVQARSNTAEPENNQQDADKGGLWSVFKAAPGHHSEAATNPEPVDWHLQNSLLRAAELESDLARMHDENQQLSAHLLSAARQLAAIGQAVQLPQHEKALASRNSNSSNIRKNTAGVLVPLLLAALFWTVFARTRICPKCKKHATVHDNLAQQVRLV